MLARLLLDAGRAVSIDRLVDDLWGEAAPGSAAKMVQVHVSRLRKVLPAGMLETRPPGYAIVLDGHRLDLDVFEELFAQGRAALAAGDGERASVSLAQALALWRGPALGEFDEPFARLERERLEEMRLGCLEARVDADLLFGRARELVPELEILVRRHPLREPFVRQLVLALYRSGRQVDALAVYRSYRDELQRELGLDPSSSLKDVERRILRQDADLDVAPAHGPRPPDTRPRPVTQAPVRYARSGDASIAYQVIGEGPLDIVLVHGWVCTFQPGWEHPPIARFYRRLASIGRLVLFDKRGTGLSDRVALDRLPDLETRMDDVRAVMDAAASERAALIGISEGGPMCAVFAATYPERTVALTLISSFARRLWAPDYPIGEPEDLVNARMARPDDPDWARETAREWLGRAAPSAARDPEAVRWYASYVARGASPGAVRALRLMNNEIDARSALPAVRVPTLVVCRADEHGYYRRASHYIAEHVPGASLREVPGGEHLPWEGDQDDILDEIERFLAGVQEDVELDRVLATVLFTDIVGSTSAAAASGDRAWRSLLERHHAVVRANLVRYRGREVDTAGDGFFAIFDGPARAIRCACAIARDVRSLGLSVRAGLHTGEVEVANGSVTGLAVHIGARIAARAGAGEVLVSGTVKDLVAGSGLAFDDRGVHTLDGVPGEWRLLAVSTPEA